MRRFSLLVLALMSVAPSLMLAHASTPAATTIDSELLTPRAIITPQDVATLPATAEHSTQQNTLALSSYDELIAYPEILGQLLDQAVLSKDITLMRTLLPIYQQVSDADVILIGYAQALIQDADGDTRSAIATLRQLSDVRPQLHAIRYELALMQIKDKRHKDARHSLTQVQNDPNLPAPLRQAIDDYLAKQSRWRPNLSLRYLSTDNVHNAPSVTEYSNWTFAPAQSAHGIGYGASLRHDAPLDNHLVLSSIVRAYGKSYWDNHAHDDHTLSLSSGLMVADTRRELALLPMVGVRTFGGHRYSHTLGLGLRHTHTQRTGSTGIIDAQLHHVTHPTRPHLDGTDAALSFTHIKPINHRFPYAYTSIHLVYDDAQDTSDKSRQVGLLFGVQKSGSQAGLPFAKLSVGAEAGVARRRYAGADIFGIARRDTIYQGELSVWRDDWRVFGFSPKLVMRHERKDSNHVLYDSTDTQMYVEIFKNR